MTDAPCGRGGCGETMACCRPDCPIEMISAEPHSGHWVWRKRLPPGAVYHGPSLYALSEEAARDIKEIESHARRF